MSGRKLLVILAYVLTFVISGVPTSSSASGGKARGDLTPADRAANGTTAVARNNEASAVPSPQKRVETPMATAERLESNSWWPTKGTAPLETFVGTAQCARCGGNGAADLVYSTYFGGSGPGPDTAWAIALDSGNNPYITGQTASTSNFPIYPSTAFQTTLTQFDATATTAGFVAKLTLEPTIIFSATTLAFGNEAEGSTAVNCGALAPCVVTLTNNTGVAIPIAIQALTGTNPGDFAAGGAGTTCVGSVPAGGNCTIAVTFTPSLVPPGAET